MHNISNLFVDFIINPNLCNKNSFFVNKKGREALYYVIDYMV